jgi:thiamine kinase-like enzyme
VNAELAVALAALEPELGPAESEPLALSGGITNRNFKVRLDGRDVVVRLPGKDTELLGIDRGAERAATAAAARLRLGPDVVAFLREPPCLVTRFIDARPVEAEELRGPLLEEAAHALRALHDAPGLPAVFDCFAVVEAYHATATANGVPIPADYAALARGAAAVHGALRGPEHGPVPCHNDYLTANFLHDGRRLRIVDWEYAGMGDRYFDLGNFAVNNGFSDEEDRALLEEYWQQPVTPQRFACLKLMRVMSDFREGMWGVVQAGISSLDFDFAGYAEEHLTRVAAGLADPRVPTWLEDARGDQS